jgi:hypothetical protein
MPPHHGWHGPVCIHGHFNASRGFGVWSIDVLDRMRDEPLDP